MGARFPKPYCGVKTGAGSAMGGISVAAGIAKLGLASGVSVVSGEVGAGAALFVPGIPVDVTPAGDVGVSDAARGDETPGNTLGAGPNGEAWFAGAVPLRWGDASPGNTSGDAPNGDLSCSGVIVAVGVVGPV